MKILLETERLRLREMTEDDAEHLFALDADPEVMRYIGPVVTDIEVHRRFLRERTLPYYTAFPGYGFFAAEERTTGTFIGWFLLRLARHFRFAAQVGFGESEVEIGYRLHPWAWGKGYATEGALALRDQAFRDPNVASVVAVALESNVASWRVMEKIGLVRSGVFPIPGYEIPAVVYRQQRAGGSVHKGIS